MKLSRSVIKILVGIAIFVAAIVFYKFYEATVANNNLVERYSVQPTEEVLVQDLFTIEELEDQMAASSGAKNSPRKRKTAPPPAVSTTTGGTAPQDAAAPVVSTAKVAPTPTQGVVSGIAAGYVLATMTETQIRNYFAEMNKLGLTWIRFDLDWSGIQSEGPGNYSWNEIDKVVRLAGEYKINVLAILGYAPRWAANEKCVVGELCSPKSPELFATFAAEAANRYKDSVFAWEIWNEPNADYFWSPKADGVEYAKVLKAGYTAIKSVQPQAIIVTGGLSPVTSSDTTVSPIVFITDIYKSGGKNYFDAVGHHPYTYALSPASTLPWNHWYQMYKIYDIMNLNGDSGKKIWITEVGAPTGGAGSGRDLGAINFAYGRDYLTYNAQAETMTALVSESSKIRNWVGPIFWYSLIDKDSNSTDPEGHFGLITSKNQYKPAYDVLLREK